MIPGWHYSQGSSSQKWGDHVKWFTEVDGRGENENWKAERNVFFFFFFFFFSLDPLDLTSGRDVTLNLDASDMLSGWLIHSLSEQPSQFSPKFSTLPHFRIASLLIRSTQIVLDFFVYKFLSDISDNESSKCKSLSTLDCISPLTLQMIVISEKQMHLRKKRSLFL